VNRPIYSYISLLNAFNLKIPTIHFRDLVNFVTNSLEYCEGINFIPVAG
jgi:hypothetical protein